MDLHDVTDYRRPADLRELQDLSDWAAWRWLAGGTWLFSQQQPGIQGLIDLERLGWNEIEVGPKGVAIGATCTFRQLLGHPWPQMWPAIGALSAAIDSLASFKVAGQATIGGNLCLALAVGSLAPVMLALDATYELWHGSGQTRLVPAATFQTGPQQTLLQPGELLRRIYVPIRHLGWQASFQRLGLAATDPALAMVVGLVDPETCAVRFGLNASVLAPRLLSFERIPTEREVEQALERIPDWLEDARASAGYRRHMTQVLMVRALRGWSVG